MPRRRDNECRNGNRTSSKIKSRGNEEHFMLRVKNVKYNYVIRNAGFNFSFAKSINCEIWDFSQNTSELNREQLKGVIIKCIAL